MGSVKLFLDWDWAGARAEANRAQELSTAFASAMEINTQYGDNHHFYCGFLEAVGQADRAIEEIRKARELDPLSTMLTYELGLSYYVERNYDVALSMADDLTRAGSQGDLYAQQLKAQVLEQQSKFDEAIAALSKVRAATGDAPLILSELGYSFGKSKRDPDAAALIANLQHRPATEFVDPYYIAVIYLGMGKKGEALTWLEKAADAHSTYVTFLAVDPKFDELAGEPRFTALLKRIGLTA